jgi:4-hydroxy-2-oxoheptanedioate aldolase
MTNTPGTVGAWLNTTEPSVAHSLARAGFDWVCIDEQHGTATPRTTPLQIAAISAASSVALVRVAWNRPELIGRALDSGADGIIVPAVQSVEEARAAASAARYAPHGSRSWGAGRSPISISTYDAVSTNARVAVYVMVETAEALASVDGIARLEGIDGIFVGPFDLALTLGITVEQLLGDVNSPLHAIVSACDRNGKTAGVYAGSIPRASAFRSFGFSMIATASDSDLVAAASADAISQAREALA